MWGKSLLSFTWNHFVVLFVWEMQANSRPGIWAHSIKQHGRDWGRGGEMVFISSGDAWKWVGKGGSDIQCTTNWCGGFSLALEAKKAGWAGEKSRESKEKSEWECVCVWRWFLEKQRAAE